MTKKIIALVCMLAILVGVFTVAVTQANASPGTYQVGYARVDINPYIDPTLEGEEKFAQSNIMVLPLRGSGDVWNRPSDVGLINDNGDSVTDENDGLAVTCIAITDSSGKTILMITVDLIGSPMIDEVRAEVVERVKTECDVTIDKDCIFYSGTHTHEAPDTTVYSSTDNPFDGLDKDGNVDENETVNETKKQMHIWLGQWIERTITNIGTAAVQAVNDSKNTHATLSKDVIDASESLVAEGRTMNSTRHYDSDGEDDGDISTTNYYYGDNFNTRRTGTDTEGSWPNVQQVNEVDDCMQLLQFTFADSDNKLPVVISSWTGHPSLNNRDVTAADGTTVLSSKNGFSSDYINSFRYALEYNTYDKTDDFSSLTQVRRVAFFQGASGNVNPRGYEWNATVDSDGDGTAGESANAWITNLAESADECWGAVYGRVLGQMADEGLTDSNPATTVATSEIRNYRYSYSAEPRMNTTEAGYNAAVVYQTAASEYATIYAEYTTVKGLYDNLGTLDKIFQSDEYKAYQSALATYNANLAEYESYVEGYSTMDAVNEKTDGSPDVPRSISLPFRYAADGTNVDFVIGSKFHASNLIGKWNSTAGEMKEQSKVNLELNAFVLGEGVAFVTMPGEPFNFYYEDLTLTGAARYADSNNLWNILEVDGSVVGEGTEEDWGAPIILGYCNGHPGYIPNYDAYTYNEGSDYWAVGSYEAHITSVAQGTGENVVRKLDTMLETITDDEAYAALYPTATCEHCGEETSWRPYFGQTESGHYYLREDLAAGQIILDEGSSVCLDLNGHTIDSEKRVFYCEDKELTDGQTPVTLNIMDLSAEQTGTVQGSGTTTSTTAWGGGTIYVGVGGELNLYGGTMTTNFREGRSATNGGVIGVRGTVNMYGGKVTGGVVAAYRYLDANGATQIKAAHGAVIDVYGSSTGCGTLNMYGGTIENGTLKAYETVDGALVEITEELNTAGTTYAYGTCVYVSYTSSTYKGTVNLMDRVVDGAVVSSRIDNIYFQSSSKAASCLNVKGNYQGTVELSNVDTVTSGKVIGVAAADEGGQAADVSNATITFAADADLTAAVDGDSLVVSSLPYTYSTCSICDGAKCQWIPMSTLNAASQTDMTPGHYILTEDLATVQKNIKTTGTYCVDLAGNTVTGKSRAFYVYANATLNIMDSVGGGVVEGKNNNASGACGSLYAEEGTINLYSGTVRHVQGNTVRDGGAVRVLGGTFNMLGGEVQGSNVTRYGGAIYVTNNDDVVGTFKASGGQVTAGTAGTGPCAYMASGSAVILSGAPNIADIYFADSSAQTLQIDTTNGQFTGSVQLTHATLAEGDTIGSCTADTDLSGANVTLANEGLLVAVDGEALKAVSVKVGADIYNDTALSGTHTTLADAITSYTYSADDRNYIKLNTDVTEQEEITVSGKDVYLDLNGCYIPQITVEAGATLYVMDSMTDDYAVTDADGELTGYGKIGAVSGAGDVVAVGLNSVSAVGSEDTVRAGYLMLAADDGSVSFHRFYQDVTYYNLQTSGDGMYFTAVFFGDEMVKAAITGNGQFGVALSITDLADDEAWVAGIVDTKTTGRTVLYSEYTGDAFASGVEVKSTVLKNIMSTDNGSITNARNASTRVYGRPYVLIDGQYYFGDVVDDPDGRGEEGDGYDLNTIKGMIMYLNDNMEGAWDALQKDENATQLTELLNMYERYPVVMNDWGADRIKEAAKAR